MMVKMRRYAGIRKEKGRKEEKRRKLEHHPSSAVMNPSGRVSPCYESMLENAKVNVIATRMQA